MIVPRLTGARVAVDPLQTFRSEQTRPASLTPIHVPPLSGSTGMIASREPALVMAGGNAAGRVVNSSRLQTSRQRRGSSASAFTADRNDSGSIVTVHM